MFMKILEAKDIHEIPKPTIKSKRLLKQLMSRFFTSNNVKNR